MIDVATRPDELDPGEVAVLAFAVSVAGTIVQILLGFYGFWLIWRVLLPHLPGPEDSDERVAPFVGYFTDPFIDPVAERLHVSARVIAALWLVAVAAAMVVVRRLTSP